MILDNYCSLCPGEEHARNGIFLLLLLFFFSFFFLMLLGFVFWVLPLVLLVFVASLISKKSLLLYMKMSNYYHL